MDMITVNQLARECKTTYHTINFYINMGLLQVNDRRGNKRYLGKNRALKVMKKVISMRKAGFPLSVIMKHIEGRIRINLN